MNFFDGTGEVDGREGVGWTVDSTKLILMSKRKVKVESTCRPAKKKNKVWRKFRKAQRECGCTTQTLKKLAAGSPFLLCFLFCLFAVCCLFGMRVCVMLQQQLPLFVSLFFFFFFAACLLADCLF